jgi:serine/threonine-protein kinase
MLPFEQFAPMADAILDALAAAHALGVIHRDLKPENVMVTESGETFVLDFGMAKLGDAWSERGLTPSITRTGTVMGTPRFMAPEQCFGIRDIDARADLWAFGVIAYRVLSGCFPFAARTYAELMRVFSKGELRAFEPVAPVPAPIRHVIASLLTISRERRPADALFVRAAFREVTT